MWRVGDYQRLSFNRPPSQSRAFMIIAERQSGAAISKEGINKVFMYYQIGLSQ
jgi:hypothetical protein